MEFCIISPVGGLEKYATLSRTHLVLAQVENPKYIGFYIKRKEAGDFLILDQGAYETGEANEKRLLQMIPTYNPNVIVLPDSYLGDAWENHARALWFANRYDYMRKKGTEWMFVPQAKPGDEVGWWRSVQWAAIKFNPRWIGLSRNMVADKRGTVFNDPLARVLTCKRLIGEFGVKVHALGMADGCLPELWALHYAGCNSIDSGAPVWRGYKGDILGVPSLVPPVDFDSDNPGWTSGPYRGVAQIDTNLNEVFKYAHHTPAR